MDPINKWRKLGVKFTDFEKGKFTMISRNKMTYIWKYTDQWHLIKETQTKEKPQKELWKMFHSCDLSEIKVSQYQCSGLVG